MKSPLIFIAVAVFSVFSKAHAAAEPIDLQEAWSLAVAYDARYRLAGAESRMQKKEVAKARAGYLPQVNAQFSMGRKGVLDKSPDLDSDVVDGGRNYYSSRSHAVSLSQALVDIGTITKYKVAVAGADKSAKILDAEKYSLMARTIEAYCNVLFSQQSLQSSHALVEASYEAMQRAEQAIDKGIGTVLALDDATAKYFEAVADELKSQNIHESNLREFEKLTGIYPASLVPLSYSIVEHPLARQDEEAWVSAALQANPELGAARKAIDVARWQTATARAKGYPSLSLLASWNYSQSDPDTPENYGVDSRDKFQSAYDTYSIMLQLSVPLYSGGYTMATVSQSKIGELRARDSYALTERQLVADVRKYFKGLKTASALVEASKRARASRKTALRSAEKGVSTGVSTRFDVLDARQKLEAAELNLSRSYLQYILNRVMLEKSAGSLDENDLAGLMSR